MDPIIDHLRQNLEEIDRQFIGLYSKRCQIVKELSQIKKNNFPIYLPDQETSRKDNLGFKELHPQIQKFIEFLFEESCHQQMLDYPRNDTFCYNTNELVLQELKEFTAEEPSLAEFYFSISDDHAFGKKTIIVTEQFDTCTSLMCIVPNLTSPLFFRKKVQLKGENPKDLLKIKGFLENLGASVIILE